MGRVDELEGMQLWGEKVNRPLDHRPSEEQFLVSSNLSQKITDQIKKAGLPIGGQHPFRPKLVRNRQGKRVIQKKAIQKGPKIGKRGYVDNQDRIWIKDRGHSGIPDHWDVQLDDGDDYIRVDMNGEEIP